MNARQLELALKKQRLQFRSGEQRRQLGQHVSALTSVFTTVEYVRGGARWVREHPAITTGTLVALVVARPRIVLRWTRRAWLIWLAWRKWSNAGNNDLARRERLKNRLNAWISRLFSG